ncbi:type I pullulanase [Aerococcaceae bacterium NML191292]|nr:type I pullulanase [Aerococcaceae bacterium NML191292]
MDIRSVEFDQQYYYEGALGAQYTPKGTTFVLWAPTAVQVELILYQTVAFDSSIREERLMTRGDKGVWTATIPGDLHNTAYNYRLRFADGEQRIANDPYAYGAVMNGMRSVVLNPELTRPSGWGERMDPFAEATDAVIYELHIRDFSIAENSGISHKGKFLGVIEKGTQTPTGQVTGLDYLSSLGVTHVQFLPMYDYASVDEASNAPQYNWGYDPLNYNVPEGSYSTNAADPATRLIEMKQMIQGLHHRGLRVIMDVVYNHVYEMAQQAFENVVPGYFYRYEADGKTLANGTECGNDTASERLMMRRYMVDSITYWVREFNLDGFRFDLMGNHDIETMNAIRRAVDEIDSSIIILGEGWDLNTPLSRDQKAIQANAYRMPRIAHFSDSMRDSVKGSVFYAEEGAFVNGEPGFERLVLENLLGGANLDKDKAHFSAPNQVIQYVEAHDNFTLYDKLVHTNPQDDEQTRQKRHTLATSMVLLAQGVPFLHAGQEFLRTKQGVENSYKSPDAINVFDWSRAEQYHEAIDYVKGLIAVRKAHAIFRMTNYEAIAEAAQPIQVRDGVIAYRLNEYVIIFNANEAVVEVADIPTGDYTVLVQNGIANPTGLTQLAVHSSVEVAPLSAWVLEKIAN